jgi:DNA-binding CsgD family transcriptional regulator
LRRCLDLLIKTGSDKSIAHALGISHRTVEAHLRKAMFKAGLKDRVLLAVWWDRQKRAVG